MVEIRRVGGLVIRRVGGLVIPLMVRVEGQVELSHRIGRRVVNGVGGFLGVEQMDQLLLVVLNREDIKEQWVGELLVVLLKVLQTLMTYLIMLLTRLMP